MSRVVVITGGTSGMGLATALKFAKNGDTVYVLGRRPDKVEEASKSHKNITGIVCDVTDIKYIKEAVDQLKAKHNTIDVLVNAAGGNVKVPEDATMTEKLAVFEQVVKSNLTAVFLTVNMFVEIMKKGGRIINVSSEGALRGSSQPFANGQAYASAKAGIHGLNRTLTRPYAEKGITINAVSPGIIDHTEFFGPTGIAEDRKNANIPNIPVGRLGEPDEIAEGIFYLASEKAAFVTGEILNINGGAQFGR